MTPPQPRLISPDLRRRHTQDILQESPRYEPILDLPPLPPDQYAALRENIAFNGVLVPILVDGDGPVRGVIEGAWHVSPT